MPIKKRTIYHVYVFDQFIFQLLGKKNATYLTPWLFKFILPRVNFEGIYRLIFQQHRSILLVGRSNYHSPTTPSLTHYLSPNEPNITSSSVKGLLYLENFSSLVWLRQRLDHVILRDKDGTAGYFSGPGVSLLLMGTT